MKKKFKKIMNQKARKNIFETSTRAIRIKSRMATGYWIQRRGTKGGLIID